MESQHVTNIFQVLLISSPLDEKFSKKKILGKSVSTPGRIWGLKLTSQEFLSAYDSSLPNETYFLNQISQFMS